MQALKRKKMIRRKGLGNNLGWFMFLKTDFENTKNIKNVLFENFSYYLNVVFLCFLCF